MRCSCCEFMGKLWAWLCMTCWSGHLFLVYWIDRHVADWWAQTHSCGAVTTVESHLISPDVSFNPEKQKPLNTLGLEALSVFSGICDFSVNCFGTASFTEAEQLQGFRARSVEVCGHYYNIKLYLNRFSSMWSMTRLVYKGTFNNRKITD